jgi:hypothetical protein
VGHDRRRPRSSVMAPNHRLHAAVNRCGVFRAFWGTIAAPRGVAASPTAWAPFAFAQLSLGTVRRLRVMKRAWRSIFSSRRTVPEAEAGLFE